MSTEDFIIRVYYLIDDFNRQELKGKRLCKRGFEPSLTDSEVMTIIEKIRAHDLWHLTSRVAKKTLVHTACAFINKISGNLIL